MLGNFFYMMLLALKQPLHQGKRIINVFSIKLAPRHGFLVQNRAIMRYTLIVAK